MRHALHILRKDVRYLRFEIAMVAALSMVYAFGEISGSGIAQYNAPLLTLKRLSAILLSIAAAYVIGRVIHAEAVPGQNQFWVTRPYRWRSLLGAKLLFILVFVSLPVLAARFIVLLVMGFPPASVLTGLLWSHFVLVICIGGTIAAVAALTPDIRPFVLTILGLFILAPTLHDDLIHWGGAWPDTVEWFRGALLVIALVGVVSTILYFQYKRRQTALTRVFALAAIGLGAAGYWALPLSLGLTVQSRLSAEPSRAEPVRAAVELSRSRLFDKLPDGVLLDIPVVLTGVPQGLAARLDAFAVSLEGSSGRRWESGWIGVNGVADLGKTIFTPQTVMDRTFFDHEHERPVTFGASIFVTLIDSSQSTTVRSFSRFEYHDIAGGLQCRLFPVDPLNGPITRMTCRAPFGWPPRYMKVADELTRNPFTTSISYSPLPANGIGVAPEAEMVWVNDSQWLKPGLTIVVGKPVAHFRRDFEVKDVHLDDFLK